MRFFGIELELNYEQGTGEAINNLRNKFIKAFPKEPVSTGQISYYHSSGGTWDFKTDSSVMGESPFEVCTPKLRFPQDMQRLYNVIQFLSEHCKAPSTGGMHIHIAVDDLCPSSILNIRQMFGLHMEIIQNIIAERRVGNSYCSFPNQVTTKSFLTIFTPEQFAASFPRDAMNLKPITKTGTIENRVMHSTLDWDELYNWISLWVMHVTHMKSQIDPMVMQSAIYTEIQKTVTLKQMLTSMLGDYPAELYDYYSKKLLENIYTRIVIERHTVSSANQYIKLLKSKAIMKEYEKCAV